MELDETNPYFHRGPYTSPTVATIREVREDSDNEADRPLRSSSGRKPRPRPSSVIVMKRESFAKSIKAIVIEKPPTKDPIGYTSSILHLCCAIPVAGCGLICLLLMIIMLNFFPVAIIVIGALYFDRETYCPAENVSLLLIIGGSISLVQGLAESSVRAIGFWKSRRGENTTHNHPAIQIMNMILRLVAFGWFIAACVIIYRLYPDVSFDKSSSDYCHPFLYSVAFWLVTVTLIFLGLGFALLFCSCCCVLFIKSE